MTTSNIYDLSTYNFDLPQELIAKYPVTPRDSARLLILDKQTGEVQDKIFKEISDNFSEGDTLVLNETRVIPARLHGYKESGAKVEIFLLKKKENGWEALVKPAKRLKKNTVIKFENSDVLAIIIDELDTPGGRHIIFENCNNIYDFINNHGEVPLPPYINRKPEEKDKITYQTIYASDKAGSVAAPTAGLHFTESLFTKIKEKGVNVATITLHVGIGTFRPVSSSDIREHRMHYEYYEIDEKTATLLNNTKKDGKNIIAVGTTVVRTLETVYNDVYGFKASLGETNIFIYPGYQFKAVDCLITNFHLPESSLVMLVSAFAGIDNTINAYKYAIDNKYRFFSYGDAMYIK